MIQNLFLICVLFLGVLTYPLTALSNVPSIGGMSDNYRICFIGDSGVNPPKENKSFKHNVNIQKMIANKLVSQGCDRVHYLGDIIYRDGMTGPKDKEFTRQFHTPYKPLMKMGTPLFITLGNHDFIGNPTAWFHLSTLSDSANFPDLPYILDREADYRPSYHKLLSKDPIDPIESVKFPGFFWEEIHEGEHDLPGLCIASVDSNAFFPLQMKLQKIFSSKTKFKKFDFNHFTTMRVHQRKWIKDFNQRTKDCKIKILLSHHPYISSGGHGNAGEGFFKFGKYFRNFVRRYVIGNFDLMLSGHDHNLSYEGDRTCKEAKNACRRVGEQDFRTTHFIVSGGGSNTKDLNKKNVKKMNRKINLGERLFVTKNVGLTVLDINRKTMKYNLYFVYYDAYAYSSQSGQKWKTWELSEEQQ